jgi:hypothetical protein
MCAGLAALLAPPSLAGAAYGTFWAGHASAMKTLNTTQVPRSSYAANAAGLGAVYASWQLQSRLMLPLFDEGGSLSYNLETMSKKLGEPLKIASWKDFYRSAGPPLVARTGAVMVSFFVAGAAQTLVARYLEMGERETEERIMKQTSSSIKDGGVGGDVGGDTQGRAAVAGGGGGVDAGDVGGGAGRAGAGGGDRSVDAGGRQ